jgi:hypothetical protein
MNMKKMPLKTLKALIECQYTYCALCSISYSQLSDETQKTLVGQAGSLAGEQLDVLLAEFKKRKGEPQAEKLIATIHDKLNNPPTPPNPEEAPNV